MAQRNICEETLHKKKIIIIICTIVICKTQCSEMDVTHSYKI